MPRPLRASRKTPYREPALFMLPNQLLPIFPLTCRSSAAHPSNIQLLVHFRHCGLQAAYDFLAFVHHR